ncbi:MAG: arylsulfatase [Phenylobacterium sp.]|uniref:arylsulfatase n=1 Tax=Phenylobacterium sp. TaxID=1871053 RepID=UPI001A53A50D|nr:arylsulfatase [Phenylobacterium sp.]MBL8553862.1 arylsulfatase [Phenylobacterium sp.]
MLAACLAGAPSIGAHGQVMASPSPAVAGRPIRAADAPNVVLILLDDAGYAASTTFGGFADTPTLSRLAQEGLRYTSFNVSAICSPTRAALLSGRNQHRVGFGSTPEAYRPYAGYNGVWPRESASIAEVLRRAGYSTAAFGKWHNTPYWELTPTGPFDRWPTGLGFEHFYGFMIGEVSQWEPPLYRDTAPVTPPRTAEQGYHLTTDITDEAVQWLRTQRAFAPERPYFLYFAPGAPHKPHHVPADWIARYKGRFDRGWDVLRQETFERQKQLGVIPSEARLTPRPPEIPAWSALSPDEQRLAARQMEVYAAFLAHTDAEIGRLIQAVRSRPDGENTLILYVASDNGASAMDGVLGSNDTHAPPTPVAEQLAQIDELGGPDHLNAYAAGWAWMNSTPFQWTKGIASHWGGTRAPLVASWPRRIAGRGEVRTQFAYATDIAATVYDAAGIDPRRPIDGIAQTALDGVSLLRTFADARAASPRRTQYFENWGSRAIYRDGWVAGVRMVGQNLGENIRRGPAPGAQTWELYDVAHDFSQAQDLAAARPGKLKELQAAFDAEARRNGVYPIETPNVRYAPPSPIAGRTSFVYFPGAPWTSYRALPSLSRPHAIEVTAEVHGAPSGVLVSHGSRLGGFVLYVRDGRVVYENNAAGRRRVRLEAPGPLPDGEVRIRFEMHGAAAPGAPFSGQGALFVNGRQVANGPLGPITDPAYDAASFSVGEARISPVSRAMPLPSRFEGRIAQVEVELR